MTADLSSQPADSGGGPRLADRLSALVGQANARQDESPTVDRLLAAIGARVDGAAAQLRELIAAGEAARQARFRELAAQVDARLAAMESLVGEQIDSVGKGVGTSVQAVDAGVRAHVDEVGGAMVLRLDEVLAGLVDQVGHVSAELTARVEAVEAAVRNSAPADFTDEFTALRDHVSDLREQVTGQLAGIAAADSREGLATSDQLDGLATAEQLHGLATADQLHGLATPAHLDGLATAEQVAGLARADQLEGLPRAEQLQGLATAGQVETEGNAVRDRLDEVVEHTSELHVALRDEVRAELTAASGQNQETAEALAAGIEDLRTELLRVESTIATRVDEAALALAETIVALLGTPAVAPAAPASWLDEPAAVAVVDTAPAWEPAEEPVAASAIAASPVAVSPAVDEFDYEAQEPTADPTSQGYDDETDPADADPDDEDVELTGAGGRKRGLFRR